MCLLPGQPQDAAPCACPAAASATPLVPLSGGSQGTLRTNLVLNPALPRPVSPAGKAKPGGSTTGEVEQSSGSLLSKLRSSSSNLFRRRSSGASSDSGASVADEAEREEARKSAYFTQLHEAEAKGEWRWPGLAGCCELLLGL
jgi:hypothetical protein